MDDDDWDLHAVVKGCASTMTTTIASSTTMTTTATNNPTFPSFSSADQNSFGFTTYDYNFQGLQEVYRELCGEVPPPSATTDTIDIDGSTSTVSVLVANSVFQPRQEILRTKSPVLQINNVKSQENIQFNNHRRGSSSSQKFPATNPQPTRQRRRKSQQMKIVRRMTEEELSADSWAWRKYGQKPIKGSPYPRNYYRCSTSKGCAAKKQVECSSMDHGIFVVSYTGEHTHLRPTHRSLLAGSTRTKFSSTPSVASQNNNTTTNNKLLSHQNKDLNISSLSLASFSPSTSLATTKNDLEMIEEDNNESISMINLNYCINNGEDLCKGFCGSDDHSSRSG